MPSEFRGEVRPRRQPAGRRHIMTSAAKTRSDDFSNPFKSTPTVSTLSSKQFPALYVRSPLKRQYRNFMRMKTPYTRIRP